MLIKIDIQTSELVRENRSKDFYAFTEIARVSREGYHRFIISRKLSEEIKKFLSDSEHIYQYERLGGKYTTLGNIDDPSIPILELEYGKSALKKVAENRWRIGHHQFIDIGFHEQTVLLCEGYSDCDFFEFLFRVLAKRKKEIGAVNFAPDQTGGSGTMKRGIIHHAKRRIVVCILDSDKRTPWDSPSDAYKSAKRYMDKIEHIGFVSHTPGMETENFIPIDIAESVSSEENKKYTNNLKELVENQGPADNVKRLDCISIYYDFKDGITQNNIDKYNNCTKQNSKKWIERKYAGVFEDLEMELPSFGKNVVELFVANDEARVKFEAKLDEIFWNLHFDHWFYELCWYLCGEEKQRP